MRRFRRFIAVVFVAILLETALASSVIAVPNGALTARPGSIDFHTKRVGTENYKKAKITNANDHEVLLIVSGGLPDDFAFGLLPGSTCPVLSTETFAPGQSCVVVVRFSPTEYFAGWHAEGSLQATATDPATGALIETLSIPVTGTGSL